MRSARVNRYIVCLSTWFSTRWNHSKMESLKEGGWVAKTLFIFLKRVQNPKTGFPITRSSSSAALTFRWNRTYRQTSKRRVSYKSKKIVSYKCKKLYKIRNYITGFPITRSSSSAALTFWWNPILPLKFHSLESIAWRTVLQHSFSANQSPVWGSCDPTT